MLDTKEGHKKASKSGRTEMMDKKFILTYVLKIYILRYVRNVMKKHIQMYNIQIC